MYQTDVLIVGAGPTGLSLSAALQKLKISFMLIEKNPKLSETSKATNLMQATQQQLASYDLIDPMYKASGKMRRIMMYAYGTNLSPRSMHMDESVYPDILLYGQDRIEQALAKAIEERGDNIHFDTRLVSLEQDDLSVKVIIEQNGISNTVNAKYVVGCDGPWSITRTFTKCDFKPVKTGCAIRQVDAKLKWKRLSSMEQMWLFYFKAGFVVVVPLLDGYTRILSIEPKENIPERNPTIDEIKSRLIEICGDPSVELTDPKWFSYTDLNMGIAPGLRDGRVLLAGDAGNPILPNGGQGLNTGIQDSMNLAWKLAGVINGNVDSALLDTYTQERLTFRQGLEKIQYNSLKYTTKTSAVSRFLISKLGNWLLDKGGEYQMAKAFSQLNVNYKNSPLSENHVRSKKITAGYRVENAEIIKASDNKEYRLFDILAKPKWKMICFNSDQPDVNSIVSKFESLNIKEICGLTIISSSLSNTPINEYLFYDIDNIAHKINRIKKPTVLLIRPDQYIGFTGSIDDFDKIQNYTRKWIKSE